MGNSGYKKLFFPGDIVENKYESFFQLKAVDINRNEIQLKKFQNKTCVVINIGSQHKDFEQIMKRIQELKSKFQDKLEILAFPSNQFQNEYQNYEQINKNCQAFTQQNTINLFQKIEVNGHYIHPVYKFLKRNSDLYNFRLVNAASINEDFSRFIVDKNGKVFKFYKKSQQEQFESDLESQINQN